MFISVESIGYFLTGRFIDSQTDKNLIRSIKKGFEGLKKEEDIIILDQNRNNYIINSKSCRVDTKKNNFIIVHLWEIQKIFSSLGAYGFNVLRFFVNIIGTINGNSKSWHMTQDDMVLSWGFSKNTVNEYLCKLEELKLLYTFRSKARKVDETFHRVGNVYGRNNDKDLIKQEGIQYLSTVPNYPILKHFYPRTSTKLKYNNFLKGSKKFDEYLRREHAILARPDFEFKGKTFETAKIILQTLKSIIRFHTGYICSNPVSLTGDKELVSFLNKVYKKGSYNKTDMEVAKDLVTYADAFEYVYLDDNDVIRSKIIRNKDSYPVYDGHGTYTGFVEYWKDSETREDNYVIYYPDRVEVYENQKLADTKVNLTGLPIWYSAMDKSGYDKFGDPFILDLIPLMDTIENLLSKLDDAVTTLSLNPLGVVSGQRIDSSIPNNIVGTVLNLEDGSDFKYASADMDRDSIKLELDYIIQQFFSVACVPSSILGQSNVSNVSETSITMLYQQTDNFCKQYIASMQEGKYK